MENPVLPMMVLQPFTDLTGKSAFRVKLGAAALLALPQANGTLVLATMPWVTMETFDKAVAATKSADEPGAAEAESDTEIPTKA
jgi:hypothetical protein